MAPDATGRFDVLRDPGGEPTPILATVGHMQFELFAPRLVHGLGAAVEQGDAAILRRHRGSHGPVPSEADPATDLR